MRGTGVELWLASLNPEVLKIVRRSRLGETLGPDRMFVNLREAVKAYEKKFAQQTGRST
jgi:hypothetical protein